MDLIKNRIEEAAKANNNFIQTAQVKTLGISTPMLKNTLMFHAKHEDRQPHANSDRAHKRGTANYWRFL